MLKKVHSALLKKYISKYTYFLKKSFIVVVSWENRWVWVSEDLRTGFQSDIRFRFSIGTPLPWWVVRKRV